MDSHATHIMTIANSIIGVSLLAMPYCFKQCGIVLSIFILIMSNIISRLSCYLMLKSAVMARRRTFEFLAFHVFGPLGKFMIEIGLIGFLLGTCIAYFVVMGDLGPSIISKIASSRVTDTMRTSILMALALFCILPLGLLRNIDSLNSVCTATIGFYFCLVLKIIAEAVPHMLSGDWVSKVELWRPAGLLQCLPIFSMALSCQTQIFEIYQALPGATLDKMNNLIRVAVNICTGVYIFVGIFGYIAYCGQAFTGNILMSLSTSFLSDVMKIGFVLSLAFSFPLIIFPCRASMYSLLYKRTHVLHETADKYIPESRFKALTFVIVFISLVTGVMIPNIELVLGLVGSTIGIMICVVFPATCFICISTKNTNERVLAQIMLFVGVLVMVLGTYANLYATEEINTVAVTEKINFAIPDSLNLIKAPPTPKAFEVPKTSKASIDWKVNQPIENQESIKEVRHEPPQPEEPAEAVKEIKIEDTLDKKVEEKKSGEEFSDKAKDSIVEIPVQPHSNNAENKKLAENEVLEQPINNQISSTKGKQIVEVKEQINLENAVLNSKLEQEKSVKIESVTKTAVKNKVNDQVTNSKITNKPNEEVDSEAIKKEEKELLEQERDKRKEEERKNFDLIHEMEKQNEAQKKIVEKSKKILEELKAYEQRKKLEEIKKNEEEKAKLAEEKDSETVTKKLTANVEQMQNQNVPIQNISPNVNQPPKLLKNNNEQLNNAHSKAPLIENVKESKLNDGLNAENLIPLPLAISKNLSGMIKTNDPFFGIKNNITNKVDDNVKSNHSQVISNKEEEALNKVKPFEAPPEKNKTESQITLFDVLKTGADKTPSLNEAKLIQHREIRSANWEKQNDTNNFNEDQRLESNMKDKYLKDFKNVSNNSQKNCDRSEQHSDPVKENIAKITSTQPSLIKMVSKLSEPELVSISSLTDFDNVQVDSVLKPLKRDLKSYKIRKRK